jgi:AAA domain
MVRKGINNFTAVPLSVIKGHQEYATYYDQQIPEYVGNPLIEALPPLWTRDEILERLSYYPPYTEQQRELPAHVRLHMIENAREFFVPQGIHLEIETKISCMLRRGLQQRNPVSNGYWTGLNNRISLLNNDRPQKLFLQSKARGFAIVGVGGMGKTTTVLNILSQYPQVIIHSRYKEEDLILKQLVWLVIQCPRDGSAKALCMNFFQTVDDILGTNYQQRYAVSRSSANELLPNIARISALHGLGLLAIDEIQDLSEAKSGGAASLLNFFVNLENTIGVPYLFIGTPKAMPLLRGEFRQARRASEQGDVFWEPMSLKAVKESDGEEERPNLIWEEFLRALWVYQYVQKPAELNSNLLDCPLSNALFDESQGVTAIAATIYLLAQRRAIASGEEKITVGLIRSVAKDSQNLISPMLNQVRQKGWRGLHFTHDIGS